MKRFKKILLGIDLDHFSKEAMKFAAETAKIRRSKLIVMYVHRNHHSLINIAISKSTTQKEIEKNKQELLNLCERYIPKSIDWEAVVIEGKPIYQIITRAAKELQSDLIIVGEYDRHHLDEILLGSNTEKIVRYAPCSVFVLRQN